MTVGIDVSSSVFLEVDKDCAEVTCQTRSAAKSNAMTNSSDHIEPNGTPRNVTAYNAGKMT